MKTYRILTYPLEVFVEAETPEEAEEAMLYDLAMCELQVEIQGIEEVN